MHHTEQYLNMISRLKKTHLLFQFYKFKLTYIYILLVSQKRFKYFQKNSQEYKDAVELYDLFVTSKNNLLEREGTPKEKLVIRVGKIVSNYLILW